MVHTINLLHKICLLGKPIPRSNFNKFLKLMDLAKGKGQYTLQ